MIKTVRLSGKAYQVAMTIDNRKELILYIQLLRSINQQVLQTIINLLTNNVSGTYA